ncbi:MAG TPA: enoyl-CoA hydratase/isomerase family protein [Burkholderiales bacterium]|nr:enoyl-CoA hydratase/isomerase family protein [Burkholderiales bacterium]
MPKKSKLLSTDSVLVEIFDEGIATVTLNRPQVHNAFDDELISGLTGALRTLERDPGVRVVVLAAEGNSFSAGADLDWMKRMAGASRQKNLQDALGLAELMSTLGNLSKPTIARVQGAAYGGGVGLIAACDIAIACREANFALSEVRLGLVPAVISPWVLQALGPRQARRYFLTGERFDAADAYRLGLVHDICEIEDLDGHVRIAATHLLMGGPAALAAARKLISEVAGRPMSEELTRHTAALIAEMRASAEGREGVSAFLARRNPAWVEALRARQPKPAKAKRKKS